MVLVVAVRGPQVTQVTRAVPVLLLTHYLKLLLREMGAMRETAGPAVLARATPVAGVGLVFFVFSGATAAAEVQEVIRGETQDGVL